MAFKKLKGHSILISVIIPCFNQGAYIQDAINSVKAQTYTNWEVIIVNDGSDEIETINELHRLEQESFTVVNIKNSGVSAARNRGIYFAKGEYLLPLDADDKIGPNYLEEALKIFEEKPEVNLVYSDCEYFGERTGISPVPLFSMEGMLYENLIFNAAIIRKANFIKVGGYDESFLDGWEDWEFWLRYIKQKQEVYKLPATHFFYRIKSSSRNNSIINEKRILCEQKLYKKHIDRFLELNPKPISAITEINLYKKEFEKLEIYRNQLHNSMSNKIGKFLLAPFKMFVK